MGLRLKKRVKLSERKFDDNKKLSCENSLNKDQNIPNL